jgi:Ran GTPase-activating protein (RanGAP) involved in mRNA processing and transport
MSGIAWEKDAEVPSCRACQVKFTLVKRRHHCRSCGRIVCDSCSNLRAHTRPGSSEKERVCDVCFLRLSPGAGEPHIWRVVLGGAALWLSLQSFRLSLVANAQVVRSIHIFAVKAVHVVGSRLLLTLDGEEEKLVLTLLDPSAVVKAFVAACDLDFLDGYRAWCRYFFSEPDPTLLQDLIDRQAAGNRTLDLTALPGAQAQEQALDLRTVARALQRDVFFTSLVMHGLARRDAVAEMTQVLQSNTTLLAVRFSAMPSSAGLERIGALLTGNTLSPLCSVDFSDTALSWVAVQGLAECAGRLTHLVLARCSLGDRELRHLLPTVGAHCVVLDASGNSFGAESSEALARLVARCTQLDRLAVADAGLRVEALFDPKNGTLSALARLSQLDLSGNSMRNFGGPFALQAVSLIATCRLRVFGLRDTHADPITVVVPIISLMLTNGDVSCELDVSGTAFGARGAAVALQKGLQTAVSHSLRAIDLSRIGVTPEQLRGIVLALIPSQQLDTLCLDNALAAQPPVSVRHGRMLAKTVASVAEQKPRLKTLRCAMLGSVVVLPLLQLLAVNTTIRELDISRNGLRDQGATVCALFLRLNRTLRSLDADDNGVTLAGFLALRSALVAAPDSPLVYMSFPWRDYERGAAPGRSAARELLLEIQHLLVLRRHRPGALDDDDRVRFLRHEPGRCLHDVHVPEHTTPPVLPPRDDHLIVSVDEHGEPPPPPAPIDQDEAGAEPRVGTFYLFFIQCSRSLL